MGASLALGVGLNGRRVELKGEVRVSYPSLGIGVAFREISEENRMRLQEMVRSLLPAARIGMPATAPKGSTTAPGFSLPVIVNPPAALQMLLDFFEAGRTLTQEEFVRLIRKSQSPAR